MGYQYTRGLKFLVGSCIHAGANGAIGLYTANALSVLFGDTLPLT